MKGEFLTLLLIFLAVAVFAQNPDSGEEKNASGKPILRIFSNYHSDFSGGENANIFEITRAYFGYEYTFNSNFSSNLTLDVSNPGVGSLQQTVFLKYAYLNYKRDGLLVSFGLVGLMQHKYQEKFWGHRYVYKSFQNKHKYSYSADLGLVLAYKFSDVLSMDFSLTNGEGYKTLIVDSVLKTGFGLILKPFKNIILRSYYDFHKVNGVSRQSFAILAGYTGSDIRFGAEYNRLLNAENIVDKKLNGFSFYGTLKAKNGSEIYARFDLLNSNQLSGHQWNLLQDGSLILLGYQFTPVKGFWVSPNFQAWNPRDDAKKFIAAFYLNIEIKI